jgi:hypothetical protein
VATLDSVRRRRNREFTFKERKMKSHLIALSAVALLGCLASQAQAAVFSGGDAVYRAERPEKAEKPEKPEKPEKREKLGAVDGVIQLAREASERPRGADNERPGDRQRRGGRRA